MMDKKQQVTVPGRKEADVRKASGFDKFGVHLAQTAWRVAVPFLLFSVGGIMMDRMFDTRPVFSIIGIISALIAVFVVVRRYIQDNFPEVLGGSHK